MITYITDPMSVEYTIMKILVLAIGMLPVYVVVATNPRHQFLESVACIVFIYILATFLGILNKLPNPFWMGVLLTLVWCIFAGALMAIWYRLREYP